MDPFILALTGFGFLVLLTAWLPMVLKELPLSLPMACIAIGAGAFAIPGLPFDPPDPVDDMRLVERLTELTVLVALMGAGLKLDRPLGRRSGVPAARLLVVAMPLTIAALTLAGQWVLGLGLASALLLAAALAPTDPVLASDVQVGAPGKGEEDEVRYALTAEAGLNDGLAFPFVNLAIVLAATSGGLGEWLAVDVVWKIGAGWAVGWAVGRALGWAAFRLPNRASLSRTGDGLVAIGITAVAYGLAEIAHGYGFIAVFVAAVAFRGVERRHRYHDTLHAFVEQFERLMMMALLVFFGGALATGGLIEAADGRALAYAAVALFVVRPLAGWVSLSGQGMPTGERAVIAFFGIRGLGTAYYLAYGMTHATFAQGERIWAAAAMVVLISVVLHGVTVTPIMRRLDRRRGEDAEDENPRLG